MPLTDFLLHQWPSHFPTSSVARRVVARGRVWLMEGTIFFFFGGGSVGAL